MTFNVILSVGSNFPIVSMQFWEIEILYVGKYKLPYLMFYCQIYMLKTVSQLFNIILYPLVSVAL